MLAFIENNDNAHKFSYKDIFICYSQIMEFNLKKISIRYNGTSGQANYNTELFVQQNDMC
jgi:transcription termination factor Rho